MQDYYIGKKEKGICRIYNLKSEDSLFLKTDDIVKTRAKERFKLDLGMHENKALQEDYTATGLELFSIDLVCKANESDDLDLLLEKTINEYIAKGIKTYPF